MIPSCITAAGHAVLAASQQQTCVSQRLVSREFGEGSQAVMFLTH